MSGWIGSGWIGEALVASALLMALVLLVRGAVRRAFGAAVAYALWALPALRLMLPPLPAAPVSLAPTLALTLPGPAPMTILTAPPMPATAAPVALGTILTGVWLTGAAVFLGWQLVAYARFRRRLERGARPVSTLAGVRVIASPAAAGPLAIGIRRRTIAVPADWTTRFSGPERDLALAHELAHHDRHDLLANAAALLVLALHWFDPIAWVAYHAFRADQEQAADSHVVARHGPAAVPVYARAIVAAAAGRALSPACHLNTLAHLKRRLAMLTRHRPSRRRLAAGAALATGLTLAGLGATASGTEAAGIAAGVQQAAAAPEAATPSAVSTPSPKEHRIRHVIVTKNGRTIAHDDFGAADIDAGVSSGDHIAIKPPVAGGSRMIFKMPDDSGTLVEVQDVPAVRSAQCGIGTGAPASMLLQHGHGPKRLIVVCTDRIQMATADAAKATGSATDIERTAYAQALTGLLDARTKITADVGISDADRTRALTAIDQSVAEMKSQLARVD